jgi:hypothetical protein
VAEFCEHGNERSVSINYLKCLGELLTCQEGLLPHAVSSLVSWCNLNLNLTNFLFKYIFRFQFQKLLQLLITVTVLTTTKAKIYLFVLSSFWLVLRKFRG